MANVYAIEEDYRTNMPRVVSAEIQRETAKRVRLKGSGSAWGFRTFFDPGHRGMSIRTPQDALRRYIESSRASIARMQQDIELTHRQIADAEEQLKRIG
jgi:hypothetical protein